MSDWYFNCNSSLGNNNMFVVDVMLIKHVTKKINLYYFLYFRISDLFSV